MSISTEVPQPFLLGCRRGRDRMVVGYITSLGYELMIVKFKKTSSYVSVIKFLVVMITQTTTNVPKKGGFIVRVMLFNATFNNMSAQYWKL
jgi:hypothetical protein